MSGRPDISVNEPLTTVWQETWKLTTTPLSALTTTFAANFGTEPIEQVYSGNVAYETDGVPQGDGLPHEFGFGVGEFDIPYLYDPQQGNLLAEFTSSALFDGSNWIWLDFQETGVTGQFMQGGGEQATSGFFLPGQVVFQLTVTIPIPGDYNDNGVVDAADYKVWRDALGSVQSLPNDDTAGVGLDDYERWRANFGAPALVASHDSAVPEPAAISLLLLGFAGRALQQWRGFKCSQLSRNGAFTPAQAHLLGARTTCVSGG